jgi:glucan phosphoethanolaminetransferase (alkaline phosphatase superfamily)
LILLSLIISFGLFFTFLFLSAIHVYWAFGGRWGSDSVFPTKDDHTAAIMPGKLPTIIVALGLLLIGIFYLVKCDVISLDLPKWIDTYGLWAIAMIFTVRAIGDFNYVGFFKKIKHTKFGINDTKYYSPLCFTIGSLSLILIYLLNNS